MFYSIMDINDLEYPFQSFIQILIQNPLNHQHTLVKGLFGYALEDVSLIDLQTTTYCNSELTAFMDALIPILQNTFHMAHQRHLRNHIA